MCAFYDTKSAGDLVKSADWNAFVAYVQAISGVAYSIHSSGSKYTSSYKWFDASAQKISSKLIDLFNASSSKSKSGYVRVSSASYFPHGLSRIPTYTSISPSGMYVNFGASCKVDNTNITVYLTAPGFRDIYWMAKV